MQPFSPTEFNTWKNSVDSQERGKNQTERVNRRNSRNNRHQSGGYRDSYNYSYYVSHSDSPGNHSDSMSGHSDYYFYWAAPWEDFNPYSIVTGHHQHFDESSHGDSGSRHHDGGGYEEYSHSDYYVPHTDYYTHSDTGFDHNDFVPSTPRIYKNETSVVPQVRDTVTLGFHSYDKNVDGKGSQDARSKTVYYTVRMRKVRNLNGTSSVGGWVTLLNNSTTDRINLNTKSYAEGEYEIEVQARNTAQSIRGVSQSYESARQVKTIRIQQNIDPELTITNPTNFIDFTFGKDNVLTKSNQKKTYEAHGYQGVLVSMVVVEKDKDQWLKGTGWLEDASGNKIAGTEQDIVWENGQKTIKTNGVSNYNANLFINKSTFANRVSGGNYKVVVQIKDYLNAAATQSAGATLTQKTISKSNSTQLTVGIDMTLPTVTFSTPKSIWEKEPNVLVTVKDDFIGVQKWRYRVYTGGIVTETWSDYLVDSSKVIPLSITGENEVEVEVIDKVGNTHIGKSAKYKKDVTLPTISFTQSPVTEEWTAGKVKITAKGADAHSGVKRIRVAGGTWVTGDTTSLDVTVNGPTEFEVEDNAGNLYKETHVVKNIDDIDPNDYQLIIKNVESNSLEVEIPSVSDSQSGLREIPFEFKLNSKTAENSTTKVTDGGKGDYSVTHDWTSSDITPNKQYTVRARVYDKANNFREKIETFYSLTNDIDMTYTKAERSNEATLKIDLKGNPVTTEIMITRQNLTTGEVVTIMPWQQKTEFKDRVSSYGYGFRYTAYSRNGDGLVGKGSSVEIREAEKLTKEDYRLKGFGTDKYMYDKDTGTLFIIGKNSGYVIAEIDTVATERLGYQWSDLDNTIADDFEDKRVGDVRYKITLPIKPQDANKYKLESRTIINSEESIDLDPLEFNVVHIKKWSDLLEITTDGNNPLKVTQGPANINKRPGTSDNPIIKEAITDGVNINGVLVTPGNSTTLPVNEESIKLSKQFMNGTYTEELKGERVDIKTNISTGVTEHDKDVEGEFKIIGEVITPGKRYSIPEGITELINDGYKIEMAVSENFTTNKTIESDKWSDLVNNGIVYEGEQIKDWSKNPPFTGDIGFKVTKLIPTYKFEHLNLQDKGYTSGSTTLEAHGNSNIQYDSKFIFNKITKKAVEHGQNIFISSGNKGWNSDLYYRADNGERRLALVLPSKVIHYDSNTLEIKTGEGISGLNVKGSFLHSNNMYVAQVDGLYTYKVDTGTLTKVINHSGITHTVTDGSNIFIADSTGLTILKSDLSEFQRLENSEIWSGLSSIKSLHISQGVVYVGTGSDDKDNEFMPVGKQ